MKVIRVLVYEGERENLLAHLRRRGVKRRSPLNYDDGAVEIVEHFVQDGHEIDAWLGELVTDADVQAAVEAIDHGVE